MMPSTKPLSPPILIQSSPNPWRMPSARSSFHLSSVGRAKTRTVSSPRRLQLLIDGQLLGGVLSWMVVTPSSRGAQRRARLASRWSSGFGGIARAHAIGGRRRQASGRWPFTALHALATAPRAGERERAPVGEVALRSHLREQRGGAA